MLRGLVTQGNSIVNGESMKMRRAGQNEGVLLQVLSGVYLIQDSNFPDEVQLLLKKYSGVFEDPTGLPLVRGHEHQIIVKDNSKHVSVRPYRYPFYQKTEIEKNYGGVARFEPHQN